MDQENWWEFFLWNQTTQDRNKLKKISQKTRDKNLYNRAHNYLKMLQNEANQKFSENKITSLNTSDLEAY